MNSAAKKRLTLVGLIIVVIAILLFVFLGSSGTAQALSVTQAASGDYDGKKVQVSGTVVDGSYTTQGASTVFKVFDTDNADVTLSVTYSGALPATFGNGVTAICTGKVEGGMLDCAEMVTKCPSKYESAEGALTVDMLLKNANVYKQATAKLAGYIEPDSMADATADVRFVIVSQGKSLPVAFDGALSTDVHDGVSVVLTGMLSEDGEIFEATDVAIDSDVEAQTV